MNRTENTIAGPLSDQQARSVITPCFVLDVDRLEADMRRFVVAMQSQLPRFVPSLSVKTNPLPMVLEVARSEGWCAEVVSADEWELARRCGFEPPSIVYNGPMKSRDTFLEAVAGGAVVNIETLREVQWLTQLDASRHYTIGVRVNINVSQISPDDQTTHADDSRFGFAHHTGELADVLNAIGQTPHVYVNRLHIHRTTRTRSVRFYRRLVEYALQLAADHHIQLEQIDIGGGFHQMLPGRPSYTVYARAVAEVIAQQRAVDSIGVIAEPGNAVLAPAFTFVTEVIDVKHHDGANYVTIDGSRFDVDPLFRRNDFPLRVLCARPTPPQAVRQVLCGCTCLEQDRLMTLQSHPLLQPGDRIIFERAGAYTITLTPLFSRRWPVVYTSRNGGIAERFDPVGAKWVKEVGVF